MEAAYDLGSIISNNDSFKLNTYELCESASRAMYNLLGNINKQMSDTVYILTELSDKMVLSIPTYNCEVWGASFFSKTFLICRFLSRKLCKNPLDRLHRSFLKHIHCVNSRISDWAVQSETNRTLIVPLIFKIMVRNWNHATESSGPIIQDTLEHSKQLRKEGKTSWFTNIVEISELMHNSMKPCFDLKIELKKRPSKIVINMWYTKKNVSSQGKLKLYASLK